VVTLANISKHSRVVSVGVILIVLAAFLAVCLPALAQDASVASSARPTFVGSDTCKLCHSKVYESWLGTAHSKLLTASGVADSQKGCEACHGPGSLHVASTGKQKLTTAIPDNLKAFDPVCASCHAASSDSASPREWQKLDAKFWARSEHSRKGIACLDCHSAHSSSSKLLKQEPAVLCMKCHSSLLNEAGSSKKAAYTHKPVAEKQCLLCHDSHGSAQTGMLKPGITSTCLTCHQWGADLTKKHSGYNASASNCAECHDVHSHKQGSGLLKSKAHGPFKSGCGSCHKPAGPSGEIALLKPEKELCVSCHSKGLPDSDGAHRPVADGMCTSCHSPHVSDSKSGLLKSRRISDACFTCHSKVQTTVETAKFTHKPMDDLNCMQCHKPHSSTEDNLLKKASIDLCKDCHQPHQHPMGKKPDGTEVIDPTTKKMLVCASCHDAHGSQWMHLTKDDYERELCVRCHKEGMHG
jgi:predicted CXXCH cytochrome family protein